MTTRTTRSKTSFNAGEFSPMLAGREDLEAYYNSCRTMQNMVGTPWGPAMRRPGTRFVREIKDSTQAARIVNFEFADDETQAYALEFGAGYMRFCMDQGQIVVAATDAAITNGDFTADIAGWSDTSTGTAGISHDAANGRLNLDGNGADVASAEQSVTTTDTGQAHVLRFRVLGAPGDAVQLKIGTSSGGAEILGPRGCPVGWYAVAFTPSASPFYVQFENALDKTLQIDDVSLIDGAPLEIGSPYQEAVVASVGVDMTQSADVLYLVHGDLAPMKLERRAHTDWALVEIDFQDGPYLEENIDTSITLTPSATTGLGETLSASKAVFAATDVGRLVRLNHSGTWGYARIVEYTSATSVTIDIKKDFANATATSSWKLGAWSATSGYPAAVTFHQERLVLGGAKKVRAAGLFASKSGDFENMDPGTAKDDEAVVANLLANKSQAIRWLSSDKRLIAGTQSAEAVVRGDTATATITPTNVDRDFETKVGSSFAPPVETEQAILFVQRHERKVKELAYTLEKDGLAAPDMTIRASHITQTGIKELAYQKEPWSVIWGRRGDGLLVGMTYERDEKVVGWHRHPLGGGFDDGPAQVESLTTIPGDGRDELWMIVKRTIDGQTKRYIEFLEQHDEDGADQADAFYVDCGLTYSGAATTTISGLDHLEGETVKVLADGAAHPDCTVTGGSIALEFEVTKAQVGLGSTWILEPQRITARSPEGSAMGDLARISECAVLFHRTLDFSMGPDADTLEDVDFREVADETGAAVPLFTGFKTVTYPGDYQQDGAVHMTGSGPFPATVAAIVPRVGGESG